MTAEKIRNRYLLRGTHNSSDVTLRDMYVGLVAGALVVVKRPGQVVGEGWTDADRKELAAEARAIADALLEEPGQ